MRTRQTRTIGAVLLLALGGPACAARQVPTGLSAYYIAGQPDKTPQPVARQHPDGLKRYVAQVRRQSAEAMAAREREPVQRVEDTVPSLMRALEELAARPSADTNLRVAIEYRRLKIHDFAIEHANEALRLSPREAAAFDLKARTWRDLGMLGPALADASRAAFFAPGDAAVQNTLGTVLMRLGRSADARAAFERALQHDPSAAYVWSNLCYVAVAEGRQEDAERYCTTALDLDPSLAAARHLQAAEARRPGASNP